MKKLLLALALGLTGIANADPLQTIARSSHTETADTGVLLTSAGVNWSAVTLIGINVDKIGVGHLSLFASSFTTTPLISSISLSQFTQPAFIPFYDLSVPALSYTKVGTTNITIIYRKR